ncbi:MAG: MarR family transcriptional regulator [Candidatus Omnitrophica bacterium]|nr:MarR family transcriptional regulator [Candidatus Omnitrophota bacterium]
MPVTRNDASRIIVEFMPKIIRGIHLGFLSNRRVTQTQFFVVTAIHANRRCSMRVLAESMHISMPAISGIVDRLVKSGYARREEDPEDRRLVMVELSAKGKLLVKQFQDAASARWEDILKAFSAGELDSFYHLIRKLNDGMREGKGDDAIKSKS